MGVRWSMGWDGMAREISGREHASREFMGVSSV